jgi:hypothetical protein
MLEAIGSVGPIHDASSSIALAPKRPSLTFTCALMGQETITEPVLIELIEASRPGSVAPRLTPRSPERAVFPSLLHSNASASSISMESPASSDSSQNHA